MKKFLVLTAIFLIALLTLTGCTENKYNASLSDNAREWVKDEFADDNPTKGLNANGSYPESRTFIIDTQEKYDEILLSDIDELNIDFEKQMLVVYNFTTIYHRKYYLSGLNADNRVLSINYKMETKSGTGDASLPYQRWFVIKLDNLDIDSVEFKEIS